MSGVAALFVRGAPGGSRTRHDALLGAMLERLRHRGPDGMAHVPHELGGLAQSSFRTTPEDLLLGGPLHSRNAARYIAADARIDNREDLLAELERPHDGALSDPEVILMAYERWGGRCTRRLVGDFAFAILDVERRLLFCARDQLGVRPLYYCDNASLFRCASEMHALFADPELTRRPDLDQVALSIALSYTEAPDTLYRDVRALQPAHQLTVSSEAVRLERYWAPDPWHRLEGLDDAEYAARLRTAVTQATRARVRATAPLGVLVSGGTDSSSVAGEIERLRRGGHGPPTPPLVLHASFPGSADDETPYSDAVSELWDLPRVNITPADAEELTAPRALAGHPDVIYDTQLGIWRVLLARAAERGIRTIFQGEGADLLMRATGVEWADDLRAGRLRKVARESGLARHPTALDAWRSVWLGGVRPLFPNRIRALARPWRRRHLHDALLAPPYDERVLEQGYARFDAVEEGECPDLVTRRLCHELRESYFPAAMTMWDQFVASCGMERRHPLLDRRVIELMLSLPHGQRHVVGEDKAKPVLRRAMSDVLPAATRERKDSGHYMRYMYKILFSQHRDEVRSLFFGSRLCEAGIISSAVANDMAHGDGIVTTLFDEHPLLMRVSKLIGMEIWLRQIT